MKGSKGREDKFETVHICSGREGGLRQMYGAFWPICPFQKFIEGKLPLLPVAMHPLCQKSNLPFQISLYKPGSTLSLCQ
jgi:hypothetical protein